MILVDCEVCRRRHVPVQAECLANQLDSLRTLVLDLSALMQASLPGCSYCRGPATQRCANSERGEHNACDEHVPALDPLDYNGCPAHDLPHAAALRAVLR